MPSAEMRRSIEEFLGRMGDVPSDLAGRRARGAAARSAPPPPGAVVEPVDAGGVPGEWVVAAGVSDGGRVVLCLHYGGYIAGNAAAMRPFEVALSGRAGARFLGIDYRLAPEHPFPAAWDDVVHTYRWLLDAGCDPASIAVGGASAGGGMAVGALVAMRDAGLPLPAAVFAVSPWADMTLTADSMISPTHEDPLTPPGEFERLVDHVLAGVDPAEPWASPVHADLSGLPPLHVEVGTADRVVDDARNLVSVARKHGVEATLDVTPDAIHCFPLHTPGCPEGQLALDRLAAHLVAHLA